ncbi:MAG TPA: diaminopimelate epimerase [Actinophytocola sp.]|uniref:diaminopimelate epimerase n=1 Tax=Actinophytocola sp. TaxID=1872138 RepID=UPI002DBE77AD|nr:diaminopimelate epimerase [Actinophytocola sp.]HEU5470311.1 diaminopimelate epimerase [Actinophytocola sp.]
MGIPFLKGHGTENDFIVLPDPDATLDLTPARVRALCDRARGLGADGVLRVVPAKAVEDAPSDVDDDVWFMDYRNADGSVAEMCGNGVRLFARYLVESGLERGSGFTVGSRAGARPVRVHPDGQLIVHMGPVTVLGPSLASVSGSEHPGVAVDVGNPHLVCLLDGGLDRLDLTVQPGFDHALFPNGVNVEFAVPGAGGEVRMRVHERGVGETRSCGTGTVAVAAAVLHLRGESTGAVTVHTLGGPVRVTVEDGDSTLTGPAVFVARGELDSAWWHGLGTAGHGQVGRAEQVHDRDAVDLER